MDVSLVITPGGQLHVEQAAEGMAEVADSAAAALESAFARSRAQGLLLLASQELPYELPPAFVFWRGLARQFFQAVCHLGEGEFDQ